MLHIPPLSSLNICIFKVSVMGTEFILFIIDLIISESNVDDLTIISLQIRLIRGPIFSNKYRTLSKSSLVKAADI